MSDREFELIKQADEREKIIKELADKCEEHGERIRWLQDTIALQDAEIEMLRMSALDQFAMAALTGLCADLNTSFVQSLNNCPQIAYTVADAMMKERKKYLKAKCTDLKKMI